MRIILSNINYNLITMKLRNQIILSLVIGIAVFIGLLNCTAKKRTYSQADQQIITYLLQNKQNIPGISGCLDFIAIENYCINIPDTSLVSCSESNINRIKQGIQPENQRIEEVLNAFFSCWKECNTIFNSNEPSCSGSKFQTTKQYRDAQKLASLTSSVTWGICMDKCNNGKSENETLKRSRATYTGTPF